MAAGQLTPAVDLTYAEFAPFLGLAECFTDRAIVTNASTLFEKASKRTRWINRETFRELSPGAFGKIEAWLKSKPAGIKQFTEAIRQSGIFCALVNEAPSQNAQL